MSYFDEGQRRTDRGILPTPTSLTLAFIVTLSHRYITQAWVVNKLILKETGDPVFWNTLSYNLYEPEFRWRLKTLQRTYFSDDLYSIQLAIALERKAIVVRRSVYASVCIVGNEPIVNDFSRTMKCTLRKFASFQRTKFGRCSRKKPFMWQGDLQNIMCTLFSKGFLFFSLFRMKSSSYEISTRYLIENSLRSYSWMHHS